MSIPILALILQGIPEGVALAVLGYLFTGTNLNWQRIIILGLSIAYTAYLLRLFPAGFGLHVLAIIFVIFIFLVYIEKASVITALTAAFFTEALLIVIETVILWLIILLNGRDVGFYSNVFLRIVVGWIHTIILFVIGYLVFCFKRQVKNK
mgnify:CR=1 FL=1